LHHADGLNRAAQAQALGKVFIQQTATRNARPVTIEKETNMTRKTIVIAVSMLVAAFAFQANAQDSHKHHATEGAKPAAAESAALTDGEVRKVDKTAGKLTIKHGPMPQFQMPAMTMVYRVKDKAMLESLKAGDKIKFDVDGVGSEFTVLHLEKAK
jgi:Cu/Ag efflux protein CusF